MFFNKKKLTPFKKKRKVLGRGISAGKGKTCGRGMKGQRARSGGRVRVGFEGGQTELLRRIPKHGQKPQLIKKTFKAINLKSIEMNDKYKDGDVLDLSEKKIKILGDGLFTKKITIKAYNFSDIAKKKIKEAGGSWELTESVISLKK